MTAMALALALAATITFVGLWSGLLLTITTLLHPMFRAGTDRDLRLDLGRFLPVARRAPTNYVLVVGMVLAPVASLITLRDRTTSATFVLVAIGLALVLIGAVAISRWVAEPNYDVLLGWDPATPLPNGWARARRRYFRCNWLRGAFVWTAFACFVVATASEVA